MKRLFNIYLEQPALVGLVLLALLVVLLEMTSNGVFLSYETIRGVLGLLPEMGLVAMGVTILMIAGEFDISVGSVFALAPMVMAVSMVAGVPFASPVLLGLAPSAVIGLLHGFLTPPFPRSSFLPTPALPFLALPVPRVISCG